MKNKILLTVIFASIGFAIFALFSNFEKAKNQIYYEGSSVSSVNSNNDAWKRTSYASKKQYKKRKTSSDKEWIPVTEVNNKEKGKNGFLDTSAPDLTFSQSTVQQPNRKKRTEENISSDMSTSGVFLAQARRESKDNDNLLASNSDYSSTISSTPSTFMGAPASTDDIIIDPGGDPNPGDVVPVGEGQIALIVLAIGYGLFITFKKKIA